MSGDPVSVVPEAIESHPHPGGPLPSHLDALRRKLMEQLSALLESQTRTHLFGSSIRTMVERTHAEMIADLELWERQSATNGGTAPPLENFLQRCRKLDLSLKLLADERARQWHRNGKYIQEVLRDFGKTMDFLASALVERDLFERQNHVMEQIIFSHGRVTQWKAFVEDVLAGFHHSFPLDLFVLAFREEKGSSLQVYYFGDCTPEAKRAVRERLAGKVLRQLDLFPETPPQIEESRIGRSTHAVNLEDADPIVVTVRESAPQLAGLLGVAYVSAVPIGAQEQAIIRSLLSVILVVVGSSKALSRTLLELEYHSGHDPLTGLCNRRRFTELLEYEIRRSDRNVHQFGVLLLDIDNFKDINDSYGHPAGDDTLIRIAKCIRDSLRKGDIAARIGGDEFTIILPETPYLGARKVAETLKERLRRIRFKASDGKQYSATASIGLAVYPKDGTNSSELMAGVDLALYHAKGLGKDEISSLQAARQRVQVNRDSRIFAEELREALAEERIVPHFQPIIDCRNRVVVANEVLARLITPEGETVAAGRFIETIEKYGLGRELDRAILGKTLDIAHAFRERTGGPMRLFVNLSAQEIQGRGILGYADDLCQRLALPPESIVFELMERDAIGDMAHMRSFLVNLRRKGFAFALDDFGSGYNSFHYLRELHFDYVKIDGTFVRHSLNSRIDRALVTNLGRLCRDLGIKTIAEFVESEETLTLLRNLDIDYAQGYHIGLPNARIATVSDLEGPTAPAGQALPPAP